MIFHDVPQASPEWFALRVGIATGSCFDKIITAKTGKLSTQADEYANTLIAEMILGESQENFMPSYWMERGALMEQEALQTYRIITDHEIDRGGFGTNDAQTYGASPDFRIIKNGKVIGGGEIKCPAPKTHVANLQRDAMDPNYMPQVQGQILVFGFEIHDWFSYHPDMPPALIRTPRDDEYCAKLEDALNGFAKIVDDKIAKLSKKGLVINRPDRRPQAAPDVDAGLIMAG